ncbi:hypothetical protein RZS08_43435, partial [Arthrospira platensis SPKY1]|nr:hypothetical protein [Arthrospira platensis SPKY1]
MDSLYGVAMGHYGETYPKLHVRVLEKRYMHYTRLGLNTQAWAALEQAYAIARKEASFDLQKRIIQHRITYLENAQRVQEALLEAKTLSSIRERIAVKERNYAMNLGSIKRRIGELDVATLSRLHDQHLRT